MALHLPFVALLLAVSPQERATNTARVRTVTTDVLRAVEADGGAAMRRQLAADLRREPRNETLVLRRATMMRLTYDYPAAEHGYRTLLSAGAVSPEVKRAAQLGLGLAYATRWQLALAGPYLSFAATDARSARDAATEAEALSALAVLLSRSGQIDSARALLGRLADIGPTPDHSVNGIVLCQRAGAARQANLAQADSLMQAGQRAAQQGHSRRARAICMVHESRVAEARGQVARSSGLISAAADSLRAVRDEEWFATAQQFQAYLSNGSLSFDAARRFAASATAAGARSGNSLAASWASLNLAQTALRLGDAPEATRTAQRAMVGLEALRDASGVAAALFVMGDAALLRGEWANADTYFARSDSISAMIGANTSRPAALYRLAVAARESGRLERAGAWLDSVRAVATRIGARGWLATDVPYEEGMQAIARGEFAEAPRHFAKFRAGAGRNASHYHYDALLRIAEAQTLGGDLDAALRTLAEAGGAEGRVDAFLEDRDARIGALSGRRFDFDPDLGLATVIAKFTSSGRVHDALRIAEGRRTRSLNMQMLRRLSLARDSARAQAVVARAEASVTLDLDILQRHVPDSTVVLAFVTGRGREPTTLFGIGRSRIWTHQLPPADSLAPVVERFLTAVRAGGAGGALARSLGSLLLGKVVDEGGPGITRLVIVPDGPLHRVPFDALVVPGGGVALERFTMSLASSLSSIGSAWAAPAPRRAGRVVAFGDARFAPDIKLPRLTASRDEARSAARRGGTALLGDAASEAALKALDADDVRILHVASHARVEEWGVLNSALFLSPGDGEDGRVGPEEIAQLQLDTELVILSGCSTLGGVVAVGEGLQGLVAPFLEAGARAVAATYWEAADADMAALMSRLYVPLRDGARAADAIRQAKLDAKRGGAPASVWANLALYGDGGVRPLPRASGLP